MSKLLYSLHVAWLSTAARRRLDGFQARCLRKILGIQHSMISRVTNVEVLSRAGVRKASVMLLERQLRLFGRIALCSELQTLRDCLLRPGSLSLKSDDYLRRVGRPRHYWPTMVRAYAVRAAGSEAELEILLSPSAIAQADWNATVKTYCQGVHEVLSK